MKYIICWPLIMSVMLIASCSSSKNTVQEFNVDPETEAIKQTVKLESVLGLSPEQSEDVTGIYTKYYEEAQKIRSNSTQDKNLQKALMKENKEMKNLEMGRVLTENQYKKYLSMESGKGSRTRDGSRRNGSGGKSRY